MNDYSSAGERTPQVRRSRARRQQRTEIARARMLDAGLAAFADLSFDDVLREVGPRRVIRELGDVSAGGFYHHFPDRESYLAALVEHGLGSPVAASVTPEAMAYVREQNGTVEPLTAVDDICRRDFDRASTTGAQARRFLLCASIARDEPAVDAALHRYYERNIAQAVAASEVLYELWGLEFRPPFTPQSAMTVIGALLDGLLLRAGVDGGVAGPELYSRAVQALLPALTRPVGSGDENEDDDEADDAGVGGEERRRRLLDAALARADAGTFAESSMKAIATDAGTTAEAAYREFGTKPGLAAATFARFVPLLERSLARDLERERPAVEAIRSHLERLAGIAVRHRGLTNAFLDAVQAATIRYRGHIGPNDPRALVPLPQLLGPVVRAGQEQGDVRADFDAFELAALITNMLLLRVMTRDDEGAEQTAAIVGEVTLFGIASRT